MAHVADQQRFVEWLELPSWEIANTQAFGSAASYVVWDDGWTRDEIIDVIREDVRDGSLRA